MKTGDIVANLNANLKRGVADDLKKSNADVELKKVDGDVDLKKVDTEVELKRADVELKIACFSSQLIVRVKDVILKCCFELANLYDNSGY